MITNAAKAIEATRQLVAAVPFLGITLPRAITAKRWRWWIT